MNKGDVGGSHRGRTRIFAGEKRCLTIGPASHRPSGTCPEWTRNPPGSTAQDRRVCVPDGLVHYKSTMPNRNNRNICNTAANL